MQGKAPGGSIRWFRDARFGMFVHWGLYSVLGRHEWAMYQERIPPDEYRPLARRFNPKKWEASQWVALARQAGMRYMCLTARHHDGFSLFDSQASDFTSAKTAAGRDLVREYVEACREAGMGVGLYYSVADWTNAAWQVGPEADKPGWARFVEFVHTQVLELVTNYGRVDYLFYDGCPPPELWDCRSLNAEIRRRQPRILISSRCGLDEDVPSAEQHTLSDPGRVWECCMTMNGSWGYNWGDPDWKKARDIALTLITCCDNGGNLLLNVGPKPDGTVPARSVTLLRQMGRWLEANGEAVYGTDPNPFDRVPMRKLATGSGSTLYVALHHYYGPKSVVGGIGNRAKGVRLLATGQEIAYEQDGGRLTLTGLPRKSPDPLLTIVAVEYAGRPRTLRNPCQGPDWG